MFGQILPRRPVVGDGGWDDASAGEGLEKAGDVGMAAIWQERVGEQAWFPLHYFKIRSYVVENLWPYRIASSAVWSPC